MPCSKCGTTVRGEGSYCRSCADDGDGPAVRTDGGRRRAGTARPGASGSLMDRVPLGMSVGIGVAAFVVNFVVMAVFAFIESDGTDSIFTAIGFLLYSSHNVPIQATISMGGTTRSQSYNVVQTLAATGGNTIPGIVYYVVPVLVLVAIGFVLGGMAAGNRGGSPADGFVAGAGMAVSYLVLAIVGTFLFTDSAMGGASSSPALMQSALFMGIGYPVVFGGLGGVLGYATSS